MTRPTHRRLESLTGWRKSLLAIAAQEVQQATQAVRRCAQQKDQLQLQQAEVARDIAQELKSVHVDLNSVRQLERHWEQLTTPLTHCDQQRALLLRQLDEQQAALLQARQELKKLEMLAARQSAVRQPRVR